MTDLETGEMDASASPNSTMRLPTKIVHTTISTLLLVLFLYSAVTQHNDNDGVFVWILFYYSNAFLAALALTFYFGLYKSSPALVTNGLYLVAGLIWLWALILAIMSGIAFANASSEDEGGDAASFNDKEEKAFEMSGALLGLVAAVFHGLAFKYGNLC